MRTKGQASWRVWAADAEPGGHSSAPGGCAPGWACVFVKGKEGAEPGSGPPARPCPRLNPLPCRQQQRATPPRGAASAHRTQVSGGQWTPGGALVGREQTSGRWGSLYRRGLQNSSSLFYMGRDHSRALGGLSESTEPVGAQGPKPCPGWRA